MEEQIDHEAMASGELPKVSWEKIIEHIDHEGRADHVGLGSDDGAQCRSACDASKPLKITDALLKKGYRGRGKIPGAISRDGGSRESRPLQQEQVPGRGHTDISARPRHPVQTFAASLGRSAFVLLLPASAATPSLADDLDGDDRHDRVTVDGCDTSARGLACRRRTRFG